MAKRKSSKPSKDTKPTGGKKKAVVDKLLSADDLKQVSGGIMRLCIKPPL